MKKIIYLIIISTILFSCKNSIEEIENKELAPVEALLMYCATHNNLNSDISKNISDLKSNYIYYGNKRVFVFFSNSNGSAYLYLITSEGEQEIIKEYGDTLNTAAIETLSLVMADVASQDNVTEITDLILSSHGGSWLPDSSTPSELSSEAVSNSGTVWMTYDPNTLAFYSFGYDTLDKTVGMNIDDMADLLEGYNLQTLIFDACFMGSIEVFYELRNSADYILASPCEMLSYGMNYSGMAKYLTKESSLENLGNMALSTYNMYNGYSGSNQTLALTVVDCAKLESFGEFAKSINDKYSSQYSTAATPSIRYDGSTTKYAYDYKMYLENLIELGGGDEYDELQSYWEETFPYYYATDYLFDYMPTEGSGGVGVYIYRSTVSSTINSYYLSLDWGQLIM